MDPVDRIIRAESPSTARRLLVVDAPDLVEEAQAIADEVLVWCDELPDRARVPSQLLVAEPTADAFAGVDLVWLRLPKALGALDEYAELIAAQASPDVQVIAGGRVKYMTHSMNEVLAAHFGSVQASLGQQKSRALRAAIPFAAALSWPRMKEHTDPTITLWAHGATFAGTKIDLGTRLLIGLLDQVPGGDVLDWGSGNGVLATLLARDASKRVQAVDVSWAGFDSTRLTAAANEVKVVATWSDGMTGVADGSLDAIVTNPPFHKGVAKESEPALAMFADAARVLRPGGEFWCVFNSHLPWKARIAEAVGPARVMVQNTGYTVVRAVRR